MSLESDYKRAMKSVHVPFIKVVIDRLSDDHEIDNDISNLIEWAEFLDSGYKSRDRRHPAERMKEILQWRPTESS